MGEFSADWLALREPADHRSRAEPLTAGIVHHLQERLAVAERSAAPIARILDLGTGSGSNVRYLAPRLLPRQQWCLVDRDVALLRELTKRLSAWGLDRAAVVSGDARSFAIRGAGFMWQFETCAANLAKLSDPAAGAVVGAPLFAGRMLVTASALLDLVSARWLAALVTRCAEQRAAVLFVLTYDGRLSCTPEDPDDELVRTLVNAHQRSTKGFGPALGPDATDYAVRLFAAAGYELACANSDWRLTPADGELQRQLIDGWADAALERTRRDPERIHGWQRRRLAFVDAGVSHLVVGHQDLAGWPIDGG